MTRRPELYHIVFELFGVENLPSIDLSCLKDFAHELASCAELPIVSEHIHLFEPMGITLLFVLASSHLSIHTWPENQYIHVDLLTCKPVHVDFDIRQLCQKHFGSIYVVERVLDYTI